jgi:Na+/proline symporter
LQFRYRGSRRESAVAQLFSLGRVCTHQKNMNKKIPSIIAAVIGSLCFGFAYWMHCLRRFITDTTSASGQTVEIPPVDARLVSWPLFAGGIFMTLACFGFLLLILSRRQYPHDHAA